MTPVLAIKKDITLKFSDILDGYTGYNGVNYFGGGCLLQNDNSIIMSTVTSTLIGFPDIPPGFVNKTKTFYKLLMEAKSISVTNSELVVNCGSGKAGLFSRLTK